MIQIRHPIFVRAYNILWCVNHAPSYLIPHVGLSYTVASGGVHLEQSGDTVLLGDEEGGYAVWDGAVTGISVVGSEVVSGEVGPGEGGIRGNQLEKERMSLTKM